MHRMGAPDRSRSSLAKSQVSYLPGPYELGHRAHCFLDRHIGIDAMLIVEIDDLDIEAPEAVFAGLAHIIGPAAHAPETSIFAAYIAEFGGEKHFVAAPRSRAADEFLVAPDAVHVGSVEEIYAPIERMVDRRDRFRIIRIPI